MELHIFFYFTVLISIITVRFSIIRFGIWLNHYFLTNLYWLLCLVVSIYLNAYIQPVSNEVYYVFFLGLISYNSTIIFCKIPSFKGVIHPANYSLRKRRILELLVIIVLVPLAYNNLLLILSGVELWRLNSDYWLNVRTSGSYLYRLLRENIAESLSKILMATCFFISNRYDSYKANLITLFIGFIITSTFVLMSGGGRTPIVQFGFFIVLAFFASRNYYMSKYFIRISPKILVFFALLGLIAIGWSSVGRGHTEGLQEILSERLALFAPIFEYYYYNTAIFEEYTLGQSMLENLIVVCQYPFKILGYASDYIRTGEYVQNFVYVPKIGYEANAAVSAYFIYLRDFGLFGVFLGPFIVGWFYNYLYRFSMKSPFLMAYYLIGVLGTCLQTDYPFGRAFVFQMMFVLLIDKFSKIKDK